MARSTPVLRFGTDGVRGVAYEELTADAVALLGRAIARVVGAERHYLVARDTRESGPMLEEALEAGLVAEGGAVESVGVFPTPGLAFLSQARELPAAMISASHNPFRDNGIKLFAPGGRKLSDDVEAQIEAEMKAIRDGEGSPPVAQVLPAPRAREEYIEHLVATLEGRDLDGLRVVIDCANGAAVETAPQVLRRLRADVEVINAEPDGRNINEACGSTEPEGLQRAVVTLGADAGLAFDGDADRVIAVDERGVIVDGDHILAVAATDLKSRHLLSEGTVVSTAMSNLGFKKAMEAHGIRVHETQVGDRYVLEAMHDGGYSLGGEQSGHVIFADYATTGDGVLTGCILLDAVQRSGRALSELASVMTKLPQVLHNVRVTHREQLDGAEAFWNEVREVEGELGEDGRVLVRPSGTEPVIRIMVEADSQERAEALSARLAERLVTALGAATP